MPDEEITPAMASAWLSSTDADLDLDPRHLAAMRDGSWLIAEFLRNSEWQVTGDPIVMGDPDE